MIFLGALGCTDLWFPHVQEPDSSGEEHGEQDVADDCRSLLWEVFSHPLEGRSKGL